MVTYATAEKVEDSLNKKSCETKFMDQAMNCKESNVHVKTEKAHSVETTSLGNTDAVNCVKMSAPSLTSHTDYLKHRGVRHTKSGKWGTAIRHPITKVSVWLGSYNTPKEAADAYIKKKLEFDSMVKYATVEKVEESMNRKRCETKFMDQAETNCKESNVHVIETAKAHSVKTTSLDNIDGVNCVKRLCGSDSVCRTKVDKWQAQISIRKAKVCAAIYTTREEAEATLHKKRQDSDSMPHVESFARESVASTEPVNGQVTCSRPRGVYQRKTGRWFAEIQNPMTKVKRSVGTYDTAEEALEALNRKRCEYAEMVHYEKKKHEKSNIEAGLVSKCQDIVSEAGVGSQENVESIQAPCSSFVSNEEFDTDVINTYGELVGEFNVGSYTTEEAEAGLHKNKQDLHSISHAELFANESVALSESVNGQVTCSRPRGVYQRKTGRWFAEVQNPMTKVKRSLGTYDTAEEALEALNRKRRENAEMVHSEKKKKHENSNVEVGLVSKRQGIVSEAGVGSQVNVDSIQVQCSSFVSNDDFDTDVINANGKSVGEFNVGSYATPEEAEAALHKKRQDFNSISHVESFAKESLASSESANGQVTGRRPRGVYQRKTGRWFAEYQNPMTKVKRSVGTYDTAEEALEALNRKRCEYAEMVHSEKKKHEKPNAEDGLVSKIQNIVSEATVGGSQVNVDSIQVPCSSLVSNGDLVTVVINANGKLAGEFNVNQYTTQEAEAALHKKRQDFDSISHVASFAKESLASSESANGEVTDSRPRGVYQRKTGRWFAEVQNPMTKVKRSVGTYDTAKEALEALNRKRREYTEMVRSEKKHKKSNVEAGLVSKCQDVVSEATVGSQVSVDSIRVPCSSFVGNEEFDMGVINAYGELVGEFSRLDDELWLDV